MDYIALAQMKDQLRRNWKRLPEIALQSFLNSFDIEYAHNSTAIEGNSLTLIETKTVLEDKPPAGNEMYSQIKAFNSSLPNHPELNSIELAAYTHAEFVRIHPFVDGNGRTARLIMNYQLMISGFLPISIRKEDRLQYFEILEQYAAENNLQIFSDLIADLEEKQIREYMSLLPKEKER